MKTTIGEDTVATPPKKERRPVILYIATRDGQDCGIAHANEIGLGKALCRKRGLLVPKPHCPKTFRSFREMARLMQRTQEAFAKLKGSLVDELPRLRPLLDSTSSFKFRKVVRRAGKLVPVENKEGR